MFSDDWREKIVKSLSGKKNNGKFARKTAKEIGDTYGLTHQKVTS